MNEDDEIIPPTPFKRIKLTPPGTTIHTRCSTSSFENYDYNDEIELNKLETLFTQQNSLLAKLIKLHEKHSVERKHEMTQLQEWMVNLSDCQQQLTNLIQTMVDILKNRLPMHGNQSSHPFMANGLNSECNYAGVFFIHN